VHPLSVFRTWLQSLRGRRPAPLWSGRQADPGTTGSEAFLAGLELVSEGVVLLDDSGVVIMSNSSAHALAHAAVPDMRGLDFWEAIPEDIAETHRSAAEQALQESETYTFVARYSFDDQWVEYMLRPHSEGLLVTLKDVSETYRALRLLRASEACNQNLFDAHSQAMWLLDTGSRHVLVANKAAAALYGMTQASLSGLFVDALFPEAEGVALMGSLPLGEFHEEMRLCTQLKASGERMLVELAFSTVQWQLRPAVLVSVTDVGARHLADAHLLRLNEELEARVAQYAEEMQRSHNEFDAFTSAMLHDLKAPLHVIDGFASTLAERHGAALNPQARHYLARIQASTRHLARLMDDLRTLNYLPRLALAPERVDLAPMCRRLMDALYKKAPDRQVVLEMEPALPVFCDKNLMATALACLLDNAWKFTSKKEQAWIKVGLIEGEVPGELVLQVSDNGVGFDAAYSSKLFHAFQRLHSSVDFPGSGLGLAIVQRVAQMHGGHAWAVPAAQGGASFFVSLPQRSDVPDSFSPHTELVQLA
jgi:PAS domain S-box-containing protein